MSPEEARWMGRRVADLPAAEISPLLNLGSSTAAYRSTVCPFIDTEIFEPLAKRGVEVIHVDMKAADGVDVVGDITTGSVQAVIRSRKPKSLICTNLLEHVTDRRIISGAIETILESGGYLFLSVPYRYPYHPDPIDTGFRPSPEQLSQEFPDLRVVDKAVVEFGNYSAQLFKHPWLIARDGYLLLAGFGKADKWRVLMSNYRFLFQSYASACVVLRK